MIDQKVHIMVVLTQRTDGLHTIIVNPPLHLQPNTSKETTELATMLQRFIVDKLAEKLGRDPVIENPIRDN